MADVDEEELRICISILERLTPSNVKKTDVNHTGVAGSSIALFSQLRQIGVSLFGKAVREDMFEDKDVIEYLQQTKGVAKKMNKLSRLHDEITKAHSALVEENSCAGINSIRETRTQEVNTKGLVTITSDYAHNAAQHGFSAAYLQCGGDLNPAVTDLSDQSCLEDEISTDAIALAVTAVQVDASRKGTKTPKTFRFDKSKVRGMYEDITVSEESGALRRNGHLYLVPRGGSTEGGWIGFVVDDDDARKRAVSLRTVQILLSSLEKLGHTLLAGEMACRTCTYVIGERQQRWALLGGAIQGLCGETAISVLLSADEATLSSSHNKLLVDALPESSSVEKTAEMSIPPMGSFRRYCNICKQQYLQVHFFYHQLCSPCGDINYDKRLAMADMRGKLCLVSGGRVRIGYQIVLKLLRAGADVIATTRWVHDAALRYSYESDFSDWAHRLHIDQLELSDLAEVERYCQYLETTFSHLDVLINNAAQTITRPAGWTDKMNVLEYNALLELSKPAEKLLSSKWMLAKGLDLIPERVRLLCDAAREKSLDAKISIAEESIVASSSGAGGIVALPQTRRVYDPSNGGWLVYDESGQPLDLSGVNSWSKRLAEVDLEEMSQTMAVNATAPFLLCSRLKHLLLPQGLRRSAHDKVTYSHIINVNALEGKFNVGKKSGGHPHTNMAKAALNMMTLTCARQYASEGILMNSVDTGWVTDMAPKGVGAQSRIHETFVGPPLDDLDGAARVLDPIFNHVSSGGRETHFGHFWKDYMKSNW